MSETLPIPPFALRQRVGGVTFPEQPDVEAMVRKAVWWDEDPTVSWLQLGSRLADGIERHVPLDLATARVLDFGCGAGRVARHLVGRTRELHGVDLDEASIAWLREHLGDHLHPALTTDVPGLPYPDDHFDLVYAYSVFTHLTEHWAGWLLELHRVLRPGGILFATVIGPASAADLGLVSPRAGLVIRALGNPWDGGGPVAIHEPAWIEERWGRAFDILTHAPQATDPPWPHDVVVARAREVAIDEADLLAPGSDAIGEGRDRRAQLACLLQDAESARRHHEDGAAALVARASARRAELATLLPDRLATLEHELAGLRAARAAMLASRSLRVTRPLRALGDRSW